MKTFFTKENFVRKHTKNNITLIYFNFDKFNNNMYLIKNLTCTYTKSFTSNNNIFVRSKVKIKSLMLCVSWSNQFIVECEGYLVHVYKKKNKDFFQNTYLNEFLLYFQLCFDMK